MKQQFKNDLTTQLTSKRQRINGVDSLYLEGGNPSGQPLILLHGLAASYYGMVPLAQELNNFRLFLPDMPGHGATELPAQQDVGGLVAWFEAFIKHIGKLCAAQPHVLAHSFGAHIALMAALKTPKACASCVLLNPVPHVSLLPRLFQQSLALAPGPVASTIGASRHLRYWRNFYLLARRSDKSLERMKWVSSHSADRTIHFAYYLNISKQLLNTASHYNDIRKSDRFYCIVGDKDRMMNNKIITYLQGIFKKDHFAICKNAGHLMPIEAPAEVAAIVRGML